MKNLYNKNTGRCFMPIYVSGEQYAFYINFDNPISDPDFDNFRLDLYSGNDLVEPGIGLLQKDAVTGILYNLFSVFVFPAVTNGLYKFVIVDSISDDVKCTSNCIMVENTEENYKKAPLVLFRNETNIFGFNYESLYDYFNVFRLLLIKTDYQYDLQKEQYRNASDDRLRNLRSRRFKFVQIESYYFDEDAHDAASAMYEHDGIYIDSLKYITKDAYQVITNPLDGLLKGSVNAYIDDPTRLYTFPINTRSAIITEITTMALKTTIPISDGNPVTINWQTDVVPATTLTYFQKHGDNPIITEEDYSDGIWTQNGVPSFTQTRDAAFGTLLVLTLIPQVDKSRYNII